MDRIFVWSGRLSQALAFVTKILLGLIVLLVTLDVAMRNLAKPIAWSASLTEYLLIYIAFLSMPALVRMKGHVCADFMRTFMPDGMKKVFEKAVYLLCIGMCLYLGGIAFSSFVDALRTGAYDVRSFDMPSWLIFAPIVLGLWLSVVEFLRFLLGYDSIYALDINEMEGF